MEYARDLNGRTLQFGRRIIKLVKSLPQNQINYCLGGQIIRSGTSIGANYREANEATTKKDFYYKISICRKESKETLYWLDLIIEANSVLQKRILPLRDENEELIKIFASIIKKAPKS